MELKARSRADLAERFLADFARESDDHDLYGVIDFYASYRAWVRGKVAALLAADPSRLRRRLRGKPRRRNRSSGWRMGTRPSGPAANP